MIVACCEACSIIENGVCLCFAVVHGEGGNLLCGVSTCLTLFHSFPIW